MPQSYFVHPTALVDSGCEVGEGTHIWHFSHLMAGAYVGRDCNIGQNVFIANGVHLGDRCKVQNNVSLYAGVWCDDEVFLGPSCVFTNVWNPRAAVNRKNEYRQTRLGRGVTIGANATLVCGHNIGAYAFIGAGAVVTTEVHSYELWVGNPARRIGWMSRAGERLVFNDQGEATCPGDASHYWLKNGLVFHDTEI